MNEINRIEDDFGAWHEQICETYNLLDRNSLHEGDFAGSMTLRAFGSLSIGHSNVAMSSSDKIFLDRRRSHICRDDRDDYTLCYVVSGPVYFEQSQRNAHVPAGKFIPAGQMFLQDQGRPFRFGAKGHKTITVVIPRERLDVRLRKNEPMLGRPIPTSTGLGKIAASYLNEMLDLEAQLAPHQYDVIAASAFDLIASTVESHVGGLNMPSRKEAKLQEIMAYIKKNLGDQTLTIDKIAHAQGVTPRTLNRMFCAVGTTPIRWLWEQRLQASYRALREGQAMRVTDAALDYGFSDVSHFSRAFKKAYHVSPNAILRMTT